MGRSEEAVKRRMHRQLRYRATRSGLHTPIIKSDAASVRGMLLAEECEQKCRRAIGMASERMCSDSAPLTITRSDKLHIAPCMVTPLQTWQLLVDNTYTSKQIEGILLSAMPTYYED